MKKMLLKKCLALLLAVLIVIPGLASGALAAGLEGYQGHWAEGAIDRWVTEGLIEGSGDGTLDPDGTQTRGHVATIFSRLLGLEEKADLSAFTDVPADAWYAAGIAECVEAGILQGVGGGRMAPTSTLSRAELFTMIARTVGVKESDTSSVAFTDSASIPDYARGYINALANMGVIHGTSDGGVDPLGDNTYATLATVLDNLIGTYANKAGTYTVSDKGITLVTADGVVLTGAASDYPVVVTKDGATVDMTGVTGPAQVNVRADGVTVNGAGEGTVFNVGDSEDLTVNGEEIVDAETYIVPGTTPATPTVPGFSGGGGGGGRPSTPEKPVMPQVDLNEYGLAEDIEDGVILHTWIWKFSTITEHIPEIAAAGYTAIQTSPIAGGGNESNSVSSWATLYNPGNLTIGNGLLGTYDEFKELCDTAHEYGVKVIVDAVINHNRGLDNSDIDWGDPGKFGDPEHPWAHATSFDWYEGRLNWNEQNRLTGTLGPQVSRDLNTQNPAVQQAMLNYLKSCVAAGADGFRFDAMRSVELPEEAPVEGYEDIDFSSEYLPTIIQNGAKFQYGESLQGNPPSYADWTPEYDDSGNSRLGDYQALTFETADGETKHLNTTLSFYGQRLRESISKGYANAEYMAEMMVNKGASADYTVTWVESHDNYCNDNSAISMDEQNVIQAWAILAARQKGTPLYYDRPMHSTVANKYGDNNNSLTGSPSYKDPQVVAVNFFHNEMGDAEEYLSNPTGTDDVIMIERGNAGAVIVNLRDQDLVLNGAPVKNMADGTYTDQAYGGTFTVSGGRISGTVKAGRVAVVYNSQVETDLELEPSVYLLPTSTEYYTRFSETMVAYPSVVNVDHATYKIGDGDEIALKDGDTITVGAELADGESVTVTVTGYDAEGNVIGTESATYTKREFKGSSVRLSDTYAQNKGWTQPYAYAWGADGEAFGGWPGVALELQDDGYWYAKVPDEYALSSWNVIFNNNNGSQDNDRTLGANSHMVVNDSGRWVAYEEGMTDPSVQGPSVSASPESGSFSQTLTVTLFANRKVDHAKYQIDENAAVDYKNGDTVTLGEGVAANTAIKLKLTGYDAQGAELVTKEYTYNKIADQGPATIYIENGYKGWTAYAVHAYTSSTNTEPWPGLAAEQQTDGEWNGYWKVVLPDKFRDQNNINIIINNGEGSAQEDAGTINWGETKVMTADGRWINADEIGEPSVSMSPGTSNFDETVTVTLHAANVEKATYKLGGEGEKEYQDGETVTIGEDMEPGDSVTLTLTGTVAGGGTVTASATYTKNTDEPKDTVIYIDTTVRSNWDPEDIYVYWWGANVTTTWPGVHPTAKNGDGYLMLSWPADQDFGTGHVIFSNNGDSNTQVEVSSWTISTGEQKIWRPSSSDEKGEWVSFTPATSVYVSPDYMQEKGWDTVNVHAFNMSGAATEWPGIPAVLQESGAWEGYWKAELPADIFKDVEDIRIILNQDGDSTTQVSVGNGDDVDMAWGDIKAVTPDGNWVDATQVVSATVYMDPLTSTDFYAESLDVTLYAPYCVSATYQIDSEDPVAYEDGKVITVGQDMADGDSVTVTVKGVNAVGDEIVSTATFTKRFIEGEDPVSVFFIGNSFTYYNEIWTVFQKIAYSAGKNVTVDKVYKDSQRLYQFADPDDPFGAQIVEKLAENDYDIVFLQEQSTLPITNYEQFLEGATKLKEKLLADNPDTTIYLYQTWARKTGSDTLTSNGWTNETMTYDLEQAYAAAGKALSLEVSPAGTAFHDVFSNHGDTIELYNADRQHPSAEGTYLAALVHVQTVFGDVDVTGEDIYDGGFGADNAKILKQAAKDAPANVAQGHVYVTPVTDGSSTYSFTADSLEITLHAYNAKNAKYKIDDGAEQTYTHGEKITIGKDVDFGTTIKVTVSADGLDPVTVEYKKESNEHYLVIGWYDKFETTGLTQDIIDTFVAALKNYLTTECGATEADLADVVVKGYTGSVAEIGTAINADGNVDILVGVGSNIFSLGKVNHETAEEILDGGITLPGAEKERYIARLTDKEIAVKVYDWIKATYGKN